MTFVQLYGILYIEDIVFKKLTLFERGSIMAKENSTGVVKHENGVSVLISFKMSTERFKKLEILAEKADLPVVAFVASRIGTVVEKAF